MIADMPFMSYQASVYDAVTNAGRLMKEGRANAVKLEGGAAVCEGRSRHRGCRHQSARIWTLPPQSIDAFSGHEVSGKSAKRLARSQKMPSASKRLARSRWCSNASRPTWRRKIFRDHLHPTIGIGAGPGCDGQSSGLSGYARTVLRFQAQVRRRTSPTSASR